VKVDTGKSIVLDHNTLLRLAKGGKSKSLSNEEKGWRGFPLNHKRLKEAVDEICRARLGDRFPPGGVGKNWTSRFIEKHHDELWMYWSHTLDNKRGRAVNPATNKAWYDLLEDVLAGRRDHEFESGTAELGPEVDYEPILPENIYGMDESGFPASSSRKERVIGGAQTGRHIQRASVQCEMGPGESSTVSLGYSRKGFWLWTAIIPTTPRISWTWRASIASMFSAIPHTQPTFIKDWMLSYSGP